MAPTADPPDIAEAQRLLDALHRLIAHVGEAYVELSGQTAATQAVVADLRRCGAFLQHRLAGEPPPAPWLSASTRGGSATASPAATLPARRVSFSQESAHAPASGPPPFGAPLGFRSPPPAPPSRSALPGCAPSPASGPDPGGSGLSPAAPCTPVDLPRAPAYKGATPSATSAGGHAPPGGGGPGASGSAGFVGRGAGQGSRPPAAAPRHLASMSTAGRPSGAAGRYRARDPSPQRRAGPGGGPATSATANTPVRSASPSAAATAQTRGAPSEALSAAEGGPGRDCRSAGLGPIPLMDASGANAGPGVSGDISCGSSSSSSSSHLPLSAQRAMAAAAALAGGSGLRDPSAHEQQQPDGAAGPPQLPLALRRAMQRYRETLQTRGQLLLQYQQRRGGTYTDTITATTSGGSDAGGPSLADTVTAAGRSYRVALARQYPSAPTPACQAPELTGSNNGGGGESQTAGAAATQLSRMSLGPFSSSSLFATGAQHGAPTSPRSLSELRRRAQVVFAALVAAQTWLIQSLSELARSRGTPGIAAAAKRRTAQADTCAALLADVELLRLELDELMGAIRAAGAAAPPAAGTCGRVGGGGGSGGGEAEVLASVAAGLRMDQGELEAAAALWRNRFLRALLCDPSAAAGVGGPGGRRWPHGAAHRQPPQAAYAGQATAGDAGPCMRRPLGFWLPDSMWAHLHLPGDDTTAVSAGAGRLALGAASAGLSAEPPWVVLLPAALASVRRAAAPPALLCGSAADAVAHGRAQLQLQATAFQLLLEGSLAAPLLPQQRPPQPQPLAQVALQDRRAGPLQHQHHHRQAAAAAAAVAAAVTWERWLAQCRLAHLLLFKGAWNRMCSVVEFEEQEDEGEEGGVLEGEAHEGAL